MDSTHAQVRTALTSSSLPLPSTAFLTSLASSIRPSTPDALLATTRSRILSSDLTSSTILDPSTVTFFPSGVADPRVQEYRLVKGVHVQVLDVENLSLSRWEQVEELEAVERGETTRGREIIRVTAEDEDGQDGQSQATQPMSANRQPVARTNATHRLTLQDRQGHKIYGVELKRMERIGVGRTGIGEKMYLKPGTVIARGIVLLQPEFCVLLGGRVEGWHKNWVEGRLRRLKDSLGGERPE